MVTGFSRFIAVILASLLLVSQAQATDWHRADTHHFTIYSDGRASDLEDFAHEVEKFDALLRMLWNRPAKDSPTKLTIYMVSGASDVERLLGRDDVAGFYSASVEGSYAVSNRRQTRDKDRLSGKRTLFHEYAHHFFFNNFSIPAPAWFVEGFAEFVATAEFEKNGDWYFGKPAFHRAAEIRYFGPIPVEVLLTSRPHEIEGSKSNAFYGWSWALTHMLYSQEHGRGDKLSRYLNAINAGAEPLAAAEAAFGDLDRLDRDLRDYSDGRMGYSKSDAPLEYYDEISITPLSAADSRVVELTMMRRSGGEFDDALAALRELGAGEAASAEALFQLGRAEYDHARELARDSEEDDAEPDFSAAEAAFERAIATDPGHAHANVFKAMILIDRLADAGDYDSEEWDAARAHILAANKTDPYDPLPLYHYAQSFARQGRRDPQTSAAYETAFSFAPEASEVRVAHAMQLASNGRYGEAIRLVQILANNPHGGESWQALIRRFESMRDGGGAVEVPDVPAPEGDEE